MNWVDIILILIFLLATWSGWAKGFILASLYLITWTGSLVLAYLFFPYVGEGLGKLFDIGAWLLPVSFLVTAIIARILLGLVTNLIIRRIPSDTNHHLLNKFLGIVPGAINGWIYAIIVSALLLALPLRDEINTTARNSQLGTRLAMQSEWVNRKLAPVFDKAIQQTLNNLSVKPGTDETVTLSFKYEKAKPRPDLEAEMLVLVNKERAKVGLNPLQADPELTQVARAHSNDMFVKGYFAHNNLEGKTPFDRMKAANVTFLTAGENLALAQTLEIAHMGLMNSPGHKANILNTTFGRIGIGILDGGFYGLMISQEFRNGDQ